MTVTNSTVSNNIGGGIGGTPINIQADVTVVNSTITGNSDSSVGTGIFSGGSITLVYATVVENRAKVGFANVFTTVLESFGSVVAGGTTTNCLGETKSHGFNFSDDESCGFNDPTDRESAGDPQLGPLAENGGPTRTRLPEPGSPLIDAIPMASCRADGAADVTTDQRGVVRPQGPGCDIGAVEVEVEVPPVPPAPVAAPPAPLTVTPRFTG